MTPLYLDTGLVLKLIVHEPLSEKVRAYVAKQRSPLWFSRVVKIEVENTLQAMRHRRMLTPEQLATARDLVKQLIDEGKFIEPTLSLDAIADETLRLSPAVTARTGCRTLDLMHIAAATLLQAPRFVSTDQRQLAAAKLAGLKTVNLLP